MSQSINSLFYFPRFYRFTLSIAFLTMIEVYLTTPEGEGGVVVVLEEEYMEHKEDKNKCIGRIECFDYGRNMLKVNRHKHTRPHVTR